MEHIYKGISAHPGPWLGTTFESIVTALLRVTAWLKQKGNEKENSGGRFHRCRKFYNKVKRNSFCPSIQITCLQGKAKAMSLVSSPILASRGYWKYGASRGSSREEALNTRRKIQADYLDEGEFPYEFIKGTMNTFYFLIPFYVRVQDANVSLLLTYGK